jgi:membrane-bound serine protease (ClpP class)
VRKQSHSIAIAILVALEISRWAGLGQTADPGLARAASSTTSPAKSLIPAATTGPTTFITRLTPLPLFTSGEGKLYVVVAIDGTLMSRHGTVVLKRGVDFAHKQGAALVVVEIHTPGGLGSIMLDMRDVLVECTVPTLGFIRQAYSAGSLLALATDRIYMTPMAHIGDAIPIQLALGQPQEIKGDLKQKILAPMKKEFATTARYKRHREDLAVGMVDLDLEILGLKPKGEILVLDAPTAVREGLAIKTVNTIEEAVADAGLTGARRVDYQMTTADRLASFLSGPLAIILLIAIAIGGIVIEVKTPGFGLGGFVAIAALFLFFWANWYANLAHWMEIVLFLIGVGLLIGEMMVPGFGVLGISGVVCIIVSVFLAMFRLPPKGFDFNYSRVEVAVRNLAWALAMGVAAMFLVVGALRHSRFWQKVSLGNEMVAKKGFTGVPDLSAFVGREGTLLTDMRPVGTVRIGDRRFDAIAEGEFLECGKAVRVIRVQGAQLVVERQGTGAGR